MLRDGCWWVCEAVFICVGLCIMEWVEIDGAWVWYEGGNLDFICRISECGGVMRGCEVIG